MNEADASEVVRVALANSRAMERELLVTALHNRGFEVSACGADAQQILELLRQKKSMF